MGVVTIISIVSQQRYVKHVKVIKVLRSMNYFLSHHECDTNDEGSLGSMETAGILECFMSSEDDRKLRYINYIGDGDSKSYSDVVAHDPYHGKEVKNLECIFVGKSTLEMGVASPVINFNHGQSGILKLMENLSMNPGEYLLRYCKERDNTRIKEMEKKSTPDVRHRSKQLPA